MNEPQLTTQQTNKILNGCIGPDKDGLCTLNCIYFLSYQFKHDLGAHKNRLIETVLLSITTYVLVQK